ncbi:MAG: hypothetical protein Q4C87_07540 [Actinomycetaceae bacterium]|nr:hypothetical protein [Actinomycetaceae bacterium]
MTTSTPELTTVSVRDLVGDHQAYNLNIDVLADAVRPWYADWNGSEEVTHAIDQLRAPETRDEAARFLGLELRVKP